MKLLFTESPSWRSIKMLIIFLLFLFESFSTFSQINNLETEEIQLHKNTIEFANEVFRDCMQYTTEEFLIEYSRNISQIEILKISKKDWKNLQLLSSFELKNKCNIDMSRDEFNFDVNHFNPLKYFFNFYSPVEQFIRVDNTNYVIHILPKQ